MSFSGRCQSFILFSPAASLFVELFSGSRVGHEREVI